MIRNIVTGAALCVAFAVSQTVCSADEVRSTSVESSTPGSSSTSVHHTRADATGVHSRSYHAQAGPGGAKVSATRAGVHANADGSVTAHREHESHAVGDLGSSNHKSASSTTVSPDGSTSSVKSSVHSTNP
ncbi:MAG TPA: hypothetical protein V6C69_01920 [Trichormus sp.]|jgi:hypothetical protein